MFLTSPLFFFWAAIWAMSMFSIGNRVYYWLSNGNTCFGTVKRISFLEDGTQILTIEEDSGKVITLPAVGITRVD